MAKTTHRYRKEEEGGEEEEDDDGCEGAPTFAEAQQEAKEDATHQAQEATSAVDPVVA